MDKFKKILYLLSTALVCYLIFNFIMTKPVNDNLPASQADLNFNLISPGLEFLEHQIEDENVVQDKLAVVRIDQRYFDFSLVQDIEQPKTVKQWQEQTQANIVINGSYFNQENNSLGLLLIDGQEFGVRSADGGNGYTGMLLITNNQLELRYLPDNNFLSQEKIDYGLQTFPTLIANGQGIVKQDSGKKARRSIIAVDQQNRVLLIVSQYSYFSLYQIMEFLLEHNFQIATAINLDGGLSAGLSLKFDNFEYHIDSSQVPNVILAKIK